MVTVDQHNNPPELPEWIQHTDPRLVLVVAVLGIFAVFATGSWWRLLVPAVPAGYLVFRLDLVPVLCQRLVWLRWFFLFVILLHALLSPGYTFLGISWISSDGLLRGLLVASQIVVALAVSLILTRMVSPVQVASAAASLCRPLELLGVDVRRFAGNILLSLHFVPILQAESVALNSELSGTDSRKGLAGQISKLQRLVATLVSRLVARADELAIASATGEIELGKLEPLPSFLPLGFVNWCIVSLVAGMIFLYVSVP